MLDTEPTTPEPKVPVTDAAVCQWDVALRALYLAELRDQYGTLPN